MTREHALALFDTQGLTEQQKAELLALVEEELQISVQGITLKPARYKINKDNQTFVDPLGNSVDEIRGVIVHKKRVRALWEKGNKLPVCSCRDVSKGIGVTQDGERRNCGTCPWNEWNSGAKWDASKATDSKGKACKEMQWVYVMNKETVLPIFISFPPTSLDAFDDYIRGRLSKGIPDIAVETIFRLVPESSGGFGYSVGQFKLGNKVPVQDVLKYRSMRKAIESYADTVEITAEDYEAATAEGIVQPPADDSPFA